MVKLIKEEGSEQWRLFLVSGRERWVRWGGREWMAAEWRLGKVRWRREEGRRDWRTQGGLQYKEVRVGGREVIVLSPFPQKERLLIESGIGMFPKVPCFSVVPKLKEIRLLGRIKSESSFPHRECTLNDFKEEGRGGRERMVWSKSLWRGMWKETREGGNRSIIKLSVYKTKWERESGRGSVIFDLFKSWRWVILGGIVIIFELGHFHNKCVILGGKEKEGNFTLLLLTIRWVNDEGRLGKVVEVKFDPIIIKVKEEGRNGTAEAVRRVRHVGE